MQTREGTWSEHRASEGRGGAGDGAGSSAAALGLCLAWLVTVMAWWGLAFYPLAGEGQARAEWLARVKEVCFGVMPNGLPAPYGWILLVLGPAALAAAIYLGFSREIRSGWARYGGHPALKGTAALLLGTFIWEATWIGALVLRSLSANTESAASAFSDAQVDLPADYPRLNREVADFHLKDQTGAEFSRAMLASGGPRILTFAYAHCQTVCPMLVQTTLAALEQSPPEAKASAVLVTLDPWRDTPAALPALARKWKLPESARVLSGAPPAVTALLDALNVPWQRDAKTGEVIHPALVYVLDTRGKIAYAFNNPSARWVAQALGRLSEGTPP